MIEYVRAFRDGGVRYYETHFKTGRISLHRASEAPKMIQAFVHGKRHKVVYYEKFYKRWEEEYWDVSV